jgi:acyl dehydratase
MATSTRKVTFDSIQIDDQLPPFEISESQESIDDARVAVDDVQEITRNIHNDPEFAKEGLFGTTVNAGVTTLSYVAQTLEQWFPAHTFYNGGSILFKAIDAFRPGDTVTFTGTITGKRVEGDKKIVECKVQGINQMDKLMGIAEATLVLDE